MKVPEVINPSAIRERIRARGLRATAGRIATYRVLHAAQHPLAHADVVEALGDMGLDRATIYRNLIDLTEAGLLARSDLGDRTWRFEIDQDGGHPHFVCVDCGEVSCLEGVDVQVRSGRDVPQSVSRDDVEVQLRGRCDACS